jgi:flagellar biosynthesis/type III secretory pathway protein FliH
MKQTAVEWQFQQLFNSFEKFNNEECTFNDYLKRNLEIREQAKEMEKQQMKEIRQKSYMEGYDEGLHDALNK